jgi:altronate dehydratase
VLPSVVCSTKLSRDIAEAVGAVTVSHQHGCGHIGPDILQTRKLFAGLAMNPNVASTLVASLGCETVQGKDVHADLEQQGFSSHLIGIQDHGGYDGALAAGIALTSRLVEMQRRAERTSAGFQSLTLGLTISRPDTRITGLVAAARRAGARVIMAADHTPASRTESDAALIDVGQQAQARVSVVTNAGAGAQLLASTVACGAQVVVDFPAPQQPPHGFALAPVIAVAGASPLHRAVSEDFDLDARVDANDIFAFAAQVFSGHQTKAETRGSATFAIPRLLRTM